jgi:hypothetical protein
VLLLFCDLRLVELPHGRGVEVGHGALAAVVGFRGAGRGDPAERWLGCAGLQGVAAIGQAWAEDDAGLPGIVAGLTTPASNGRPPKKQTPLSLTGGTDTADKTDIGRVGECSRVTARLISVHHALAQNTGDTKVSTICVYRSLPQKKQNP